MRALGCGPTATTGLSQNGPGVNQTIVEKKTVLSLLYQGGMTNPATQNKDLFAAKQLVQVKN